MTNTKFVLKNTLGSLLGPTIELARFGTLKLERRNSLLKDIKTLSIALPSTIHLGRINKIANLISEKSIIVNVETCFCYVKTEIRWSQGHSIKLRRYI